MTRATATAPRRPNPPGKAAGKERAKVTRLGPDERREQLVQIGLALLKTTPFEQITVDEIARRAGISKGLVFHYFPTKREMQAAVLRAAGAELVAELTSEPDLPIEEQLVAGIDAFITYIEQRPGTYVAIVRGSGTDPLLTAVFDETRAAVVAYIAQRLAIASPPPAMRVAIRSYIAMIEEATLDWLHDRAFPRAELVRFLEQVGVQLLPAAADLVVRSGQLDEIPPEAMARIGAAFEPSAKDAS